MERILRRTLLHVMYSSGTWAVHKVLVWVLETIAYFILFLTLVISTLLILDYSYFYHISDVSETLLNTIVIFCLSVSSGIAYFRSLKYKPEEKIRKLLEDK